MPGLRFAITFVSFVAALSVWHQSAMAEVPDADRLLSQRAHELLAIGKVAEAADSARESIITCMSIPGKDSDCIQTYLWWRDVLKNDHTALNRFLAPATPPQRHICMSQWDRLKLTRLDQSCEAIPILQTTLKECAGDELFNFYEAIGAILRRYDECGMPEQRDRLVATLTAGAAPFYWRARLDKKRSVERKIEGTDGERFTADENAALETAISVATPAALKLIEKDWKHLPHFGAKALLKRKLQAARTDTRAPTGDLGWTNIPPDVRALSGLHDISAITRDETSIYTGHQWGITLYKLDGTPTTRIAVGLPITALAAGGGVIWAGTPEGLMRLERHDTAQWTIERVVLDDDGAAVRKLSIQSDPHCAGFYATQIQSLTLLNNDLWIATCRSLARLDIATRQLEQQPYFPQDLVAAHGFVWMKAPLRRYDPKTRHWLDILNPAGQVALKGFHGIRLVVAESNGGALHLLDPVDLTFTAYPQAEQPETATAEERHDAALLKFLGSIHEGDRQAVQWRYRGTELATPAFKTTSLNIIRGDNQDLIAASIWRDELNPDHNSPKHYYRDWRQDLSGQSGLTRITAAGAIEALDTSAFGDVLPPVMLTVPVPPLTEELRPDRWFGSSAGLVVLDNRDRVSRYIGEAQRFPRGLIIGAESGAPGRYLLKRNGIVSEVFPSTEPERYRVEYRKAEGSYLTAVTSDPAGTQLTLPYLGGPVFFQHVIGDKNYLGGARGLIIYSGSVPATLQFPEWKITRSSEISPTLLALLTQEGSPIEAGITSGDEISKLSALQALLSLNRGRSPSRICELMLTQMASSQPRAVETSAINFLAEHPECQGGEVLRHFLSDGSRFPEHPVAVLGLARMDILPNAVELGEFLQRASREQRLRLGRILSRSRNPEALTALLAVSPTNHPFEDRSKLQQFLSEDLLWTTLGATLRDSKSTAELLMAAPTSLKNADTGTHLPLQDRYKDILEPSSRVVTLARAIGPTLLTRMHEVLLLPEPLPQQANAALVCGALGDPESVKPLLAQLHSPLPAVQARVLWALSQLNAKEASGPLASLAHTLREKRPTPGVDEICFPDVMDSLLRIDPAAAVPLLRQNVATP